MPSAEPITVRSITPGAVFVNFTCSDSPAFRLTDGLSAFTLFNTKSAEVGRTEGNPAPGGPGPGVIFPNGLSRNASRSTYQLHFPPSSFQMLGDGIFIGLSVKP